MSSDIHNIKLSFKCPASWDEMQPVNGGRHCTQCNKTVYDFTNSKQQEFLQIMAEQNGHICGRFRQEQLAAQSVALRGWKKLLSAAVVLLGISVFHQAKAQEKDTLPTIKIDEKTNDDLTIFGGVDTPTPSFPGGLPALQLYLKQHLKYPKGAINGKVFATFVVSKNGKLTDINIIRGLSPVNDAEVIRVLKQMPKWKAGTINGKPINTQYTIPVAFVDK